MSLPEAAERLGVSLKAARRAAKAGDLPVIPWGRTFLVLREPLEALLSTGSAPTKDRPTIKT
jgi:excisionase family DNA binding protein